MNDNVNLYKEAIWGTLASVAARAIPAAARLAPKVTSVATKAYNGFARAGVGRKALWGSGLGAVAGNAKYNPQQDDGSFGQSRFGKMLGGAAVGAGIGASVGMATKGLRPMVPKSSTMPATRGLNSPIKQVQAPKAAPRPTPHTSPNPTTNPYNAGDVIALDPSEFRVINASQFVDEFYMEKTSAFNAENINRAKSLLQRVKKLPFDFIDANPSTRMLVGAIIGGGIGALKKEKLDEVEKSIDEAEKKEENPLQKLKNKIPKRVQNIGMGALIGSTLGYVSGVKKFPGADTKSKNPLLLTASDFIDNFIEKQSS